MYTTPNSVDLVAFLDGVDPCFIFKYFFNDSSFISPTPTMQVIDANITSSLDLGSSTNNFSTSTLHAYVPLLCTN